MWHDIFLALWFMIPAGLANGAPLVAAKLPVISCFNAPIDFGYTWHGKPFFGAHKTWRGLIAGIIVATLTFWLQQLAVANSEWLQLATAVIDYQNIPALVIGPLFGLGALGGDAIKSFFKRRVGIEPGEQWPPFDQIDFLVGALILTWPYSQFDFTHILLVFAVWIPLHYAGNLLGWLLRLKDRPI